MSYRVYHTLEDATEAHVDELAPNLRNMDAAEVAAHGLSPRDALLNSMKHSDAPKAVIVDGKVIAIFGIAKMTLLSDEAVPWMLGSHEIPNHAKAFLRFGRAWIAEVRKQHPVLIGHVDVRYTQAIRWLEWLGFTIEPAIPVGPKKMLFHPAVLRTYDA